MFGDVYQGRRVLVTGHTGFKGSWLCLWLQALGAHVTAVSLPPPTAPNHWDSLRLQVAGHHVDIRDRAALLEVMREAQPEIVFHLAAQALVLDSYRDPLETWSTNVMGTAHVLEACRHIPQLRAVVVVTSDKCYENLEQERGYRETDALGGHDPYSASKAGTELVTASYRRAFFGSSGAALMATARAGNVIGGGDWAPGRLIPDLVRSVQSGQVLRLRSPHATRPWQHVLEPLGGYLALGQQLLEGNAQAASAWNFGPDANATRTVAALLGQLAKHWPEVTWETSPEAHPHEARLLALDSAKARDQLQWRPVWSLDEALAATADWYKAFVTAGEITSPRQLDDYVGAATRAGLPWAAR